MMDITLGGAMALSAPVVLVAGGSDTVALALLGVFAVGLLRVVQAGLRAMRSDRNPLWPVVKCGGWYWLGASVASIAAWNVAFAILAPGLAFHVGPGDLSDIWAGAAVSVAVVAGVTTAVHAFRSRPA